MKNNSYYFPCPICRRMLRINESKTNKPYCVCNDCGMQLFIRGRRGINRFAGLVGQAVPKGRTRELVRAIDYFNALKDQLKELDSSRPILGVDKDIELQIIIVNRELARLRADMKEAVKRQTPKKRG